MPKYEIVIDHSGFVMDTSDDLDEAKRVADARTKEDLILHTVRPAELAPT